MNKKMVNPRHPTLFNEPVEITHALVAVASQDGYEVLSILCGLGVFDKYL
jgi:hypothetical protein